MLRRARYRERRHGCREQQDRIATPGGYVWARGQDPEGGSGPFAILRGPCAGHRQLEEICGWLGTFRERLRVARVEEHPHLAAVVEHLEARYVTSRAELS